MQFFSRIFIQAVVHIGGPTNRGHNTPVVVTDVYNLYKIPIVDLKCTHRRLQSCLLGKNCIWAAQMMLSVSHPPSDKITPDHRSPIMMAQAVGTAFHPQVWCPNLDITMHMGILQLQHSGRAGSSETLLSEGPLGPAPVL